jgi:hypothetical protein
MECTQFYLKVPKTAQKFCWVKDLLRKCHTFLGQELYKDQKFCFQNLGFMGFMGSSLAVSCRRSVRALS